MLLVHMLPVGPGPVDNGVCHKASFSGPSVTSQYLLVSGGVLLFAGTNVHEQSRSDFCKLRFKSKLYSKIMALSSAMKPPGRTVYYSGESA